MGGKPGGQKGRIRRFPRPELGGGAGRKAKGVRRKGQHPSLNVFYQLVTMFDISVDQFFYPDMGADDACKKRINIMLSSMNKKELELVEKLIRAVKDSQETEGA